MSIIDRAIKYAAGKRGLLQDPDSWVARHFGRPTTSGVNVTEETALTFSAVYSCVSVLSRSIAAMPLPVYERMDRGRRRARENKVYKLLHSQPNTEMTSYQLRSTMMAHLALWGNAYAEIEFDGMGDPSGLWLIPAWKVNPQRAENTNELYYEVTLPNGQSTKLQKFRVLHILGLGIDGNKGLSPIELHRQGIGMGLAAEEFGSRFFGQGTNLGGIVEMPGKMRDETIRALREDIKGKHEGLGRSHRLLFLEEGVKYHQVGMPLTDAQFLESRKFQKTEVASIYNVPPHMIGDLERATFSNIEHQSIEFVTHTMTPWLVNWEQELNRKLFQDDKYYAEFLVEGLLRGDSASRAQFYNQMFNIGAYSINDIREKENENPIGPEGDVHYIPLNMLPAQHAAVPDTEEESERSIKTETRTLEQRQQSALRRTRLRDRYRTRFREAAAEISKREKQNIMRAVNKHLSDRSISSFKDYLEDHYRDFPEFITRQMRPVFQSLAAPIYDLAAEEVGSVTGITAAVERQVDNHLAEFAAAYAGSSRAQLFAVARDAAEEGLDVAGEVEQRVTEWEERRPNKVAMDETVAVASLVAKGVFAGAGIQKLRWRALGSESCEFCEELDGRVVGIDQPFIAADGVLEAEGRDHEMVINKPTLQPPLHQFCVCEIVPE